ncbi:hypothetical protein B0H12DRAFT_1242768 [Mycena haematopus]|nr:hypothetical protein B0H12DRAFT_1242768 [Mycena haematopus]
MPPRGQARLAAIDDVATDVDALASGISSACGSSDYGSVDSAFNLSNSSGWEDDTTPFFQEASSFDSTSFTNGPSASLDYSAFSSFGRSSFGPGSSSFDGLAFRAGLCDTSI